LKNIQIAGYNFVNVKPDKHTSGVSMYMTSKLKFSQLKNYKLHGTVFIWLKISKNKSAKTFVIGSIYRHPSKDANNFIDDFSKCL